MTSRSPPPINDVEDISFNNYSNFEKYLENCRTHLWSKKFLMTSEEVWRSWTMLSKVQCLLQMLKTKQQVMPRINTCKCMWLTEKPCCKYRRWWEYVLWWWSSYRVKISQRDQRLPLLILWQTQTCSHLSVTQGDLQQSTSIARSENLVDIPGPWL